MKIVMFSWIARATMCSRALTITAFCAVLLIIPISSGCSTISAHDNFLEALNEAIGQSIDNVPAYTWPRENELINSVILPNGNLKYRYKYYKGTCVYVFEIDPKIRRIVGASFEGKESDCIINP